MTAEHAPRWRDPEELPVYLDDAVDRSYFEFTTGMNHFSSMFGFGGPPDPIYEGESEFAEQMAARSFSSLSWSTVNYVADMEALLSGDLEVRSRRQFGGLLLREFEGAIRTTWFQIAKVNDPVAVAAETSGKKANEAHASQVRYLSARFGLSDDERELWLSTTGEGGLSQYVHHRVVRAPSAAETEKTDSYYRDVFELLKKLAQAANDEYGWTVTYFARLIEGGAAALDARSKDAIKHLRDSVPDNENLRAWFLAQLHEQEWIVPLSKARFLGVGEGDRLTVVDGTARAPIVHSLRMLVRVVEGLAIPTPLGSPPRPVRLKDDETLASVDAIIDEWLPEGKAPVNPRAHTDVVELLMRLGKAGDEVRVKRLLDLYVRDRWYSRVTRLVGDLGLVRFPLQMARLADHLDRIGRTALSDLVAGVTREAVLCMNDDEDVENIAAFFDHLVRGPRPRRRLGLR